MVQSPWLLLPLNPGRSPLTNKQTSQLTNYPPDPRSDRGVDPYNRAPARARRTPHSSLLPLRLRFAPDNGSVPMAPASFEPWPFFSNQLTNQLAPDRQRHRPLQPQAERLSTFYFHLSAFNFQLSTFNFPLSHRDNSCSKTALFTGLARCWSNPSFRARSISPFSA